jgi:hypothetical protein
MKKQKTVTDRINNKIKKLNAAYRKASPVQRRRMIVKDALKQIEAGQIKPTSGTYIRVWPDKGKPVVDLDDPLQPVLLEQGAVTCDCCAKGALFVSAVRLSNRFNGDPTGIGSGTINETVEWPEENYHEIESAFESDRGDWWFDTYPDDTKRLVAILKNILRNKRALFTLPKEAIKPRHRLLNTAF